MATSPTTSYLEQIGMEAHGMFHERAVHVNIQIYNDTKQAQIYYWMLKNSIENHYTSIACKSFKAHVNSKIYHLLVTVWKTFLPCDDCFDKSIFAIMFHHNKK